MALTEYNYSISGDTANGKVFPTTLTQQINDSSIATPLAYINTSGDDLDIWFDDPLSGPDETTLTAVVAAHTGVVDRQLTEQFVQSVLDKDLTDPPVSPSVGDRYIVASGATGAWATYDDKIAEWDGTEWDFSDPNVTCLLFLADRKLFYYYIDGSWEPLQDNAISAYDSDGTQTFTGTVTVNLDATHVVDSAFYSLSGSEITVALGGRYELCYDVSLKVTNGSSRSQADCWLERNGVEEPGTRSTCYMRQQNYGATASLAGISLDVVAGDVFRLRASRTVGTNTLSPLLNGSRLRIKRS